MEKNGQARFEAWAGESEGLTQHGRSRTFKDGFFPADYVDSLGVQVAKQTVHAGGECTERAHGYMANWDAPGM